jgi:hypothetical protein
MGCLSGEKLRNALYIRSLQVFEVVFLLIPHAERAKVCMELNIAHSVRVIRHAAVFMGLSLVFMQE